VDLYTHGAAHALGAHLHDQWLENLGVSVRLTLLPWAEFLELIDADPPHLFLVCWVADYPDPDSFLRVVPQLHTAWRSQRYLSLVDRARQATDQEQRMTLYAEVERLLAQEVPLLPVAYEREHVLIKPWVKKHPMSAQGDLFWQDVIIEPH
jgi:ABC-type oligopeptide transport system substrate-binding subunit